MRTESRELLAVGIFGSKSRIGERIEMLLRGGRTFSPRASVIGVAASAAVLGTLTLAGSLVPRWIAFAQQQSPAQFEVASVKPNNSGDYHWYIRIAPGGKLLALNATLRSLILQAYEVQDFQLSGGTAWLNSGGFDIEGRGQGSPAPNQVLQMLQALLADRFQLKIHKEVRELPVYALLIGKNGPKLEASHRDCFDPVADPTAFIAPATLPCGGFRNASNGMEGTKITMSRFTVNLSKYTGRAVVDKTGLEGAYDITLRWTSDEAQAFSPPPSPPADDSSGPSIFAAIHEQLGLKLESAKGPVETLVIDHAEKPDAN